jgi:hypothetical protein
LERRTTPGKEQANHLMTKTNPDIWILPRWSFKSKETMPEKGFQPQSEAKSETTSGTLGEIAEKTRTCMEE